MTDQPLQSGDPFCTQCGFVLRGHEGDASCPECHAPLPAAIGRFDAAARRTLGTRSVRRRSHATLWGLPLVDIALGPDVQSGERVGKARGIVAVGDVAFGGLAIGGGAVGVVAIGGGSVGVVSLGGGAIGLLAAVGGGALGGYAAGGIAAGGLCTGGLGLGYIAQGGAAVGVYARGPGARGTHVINRNQTDPAAVSMFETLSPVLGKSGPGGALTAAAMPLGFVPPIVLGGLLAAIIGLLVLVGQRRHERQIGARKRLGDLAAEVAGDTDPEAMGGRAR